MNTYVLISKSNDATKIVDKVKASTLAQGARKLYRAKQIDPKEATSLGYSVEFYKQTKDVANG